MKLVRVGKPGQERPGVLDGDGVARDVSGLVADFGPAFFAGDDVASLAGLDLAGLPVLEDRMVRLLRVRERWCVSG